MHSPVAEFLTLFLFGVQIVEPFTAHYVFALGVARFLSCAHWVLQVLFSASFLLKCCCSFEIWTIEPMQMVFRPVTVCNINMGG